MVSQSKNFSSHPMMKPNWSTSGPLFGESALCKNTAIWSCGKLLFWRRQNAMPLNTLSPKTAALYCYIGHIRALWVGSGRAILIQKKRRSCQCGSRPYLTDKEIWRTHTAFRRVLSTSKKKLDQFLEAMAVI